MTTADELLQLPDDGHRHELVRGVVRSKLLRGMDEGLLLAKVSALLGAYIERHRLGVLSIGAGYLLEESPDTVRQSDLAFVRRDRLAGRPIPTGYYPGAPDLSVEVMSPSDTVEQVDEKVQDWLEHGVEAVWVLSPWWKTICVSAKGDLQRSLKVGDTLEDVALLPGFRCPVSEMFELG